MAKIGWLLAVLCLAFSPGPLQAEAIERELLHEEATFVLEIQQPMRWAAHPVLKRLWSTLSQSDRLRTALETPEFQRVFAARDYLEAASGQKWEEALSQMTAGGVWVGITPKPNERASLIITADNADVWTRLESAALKAVKSQGQQPPAAQSYQGVKTYRIEKSFLALVGRRLVAASHEADLKRIIEGLLKHSEASEALPKSARPLLDLEIHLESIRQTPDLQKAIERPSNDAGQLAIFGGWLDVLAHGNRLNAKLEWPKDSTEIHLKLTARNVDAAVPLPGFFARSSNEALAPLLEPPGTIYSASWFRDYKALWNRRADLLTDQAREKLEKGEANLKEVASLGGTIFSPSEFFLQLGTQYRIVLARAEESEYRVKLDNKLPAAAMCVSLRDEKAFREQAEPLGRLIGAISFGEAKMLTKTSDHAQAQLTGLWFRDDEKALQTGNRLRFNFCPTWSIAREHFIVGSTRKIVAQVIDELDRQAAESSKDLDTASSALITDRQLFSFPQVGEALTDFRMALQQGGALDRGLTLPQSIHEFDLAKEAFHSLGQLATQAAFTEQGFEYTIRLSEGSRR